MDLTAPKIVVMVQVVKSAAGVALVREYYSLKKYNIKQLTQPPKVEEPGKQCSRDILTE